MPLRYSLHFLRCTLVLLSMALLSFSASARQSRAKIAAEIEQSMRSKLLNVWYPRSIDKQYGGFLSSFTYDWQPTGSQDKMIVTQARHTWSNAIASQLYPKEAHYKTGARHGFTFLRDVLWDKQHGGFHTLVNRQGQVIRRGFAEKEAYGNAFALYALSAYYKATGDKEALALAQETFRWLEKHSHDPVHKGYFQHLKLDGTPIVRFDTISSTSDLGYKDQNTSIHLLEAFTELYQIWPDPLVRERLQEMLFLIRDKITTRQGYMVLFFQPDWTPVSFRDTDRETILRHRYLDHVSFGHDVETAYLLLEASHVLGLKNDTTTLRVAKRMVDHSLRNGWDAEKGGFYEEGYYFKGDANLTITKDAKNWWSQAEGLNTLLLMADLFPKDEMQYYQKFETLWRYISTYLIDQEHGGWYAGGLDKEPNQKTALKGHIWKGNYHQLRAMANCVARLKHENHKTPHKQ
ncbi:AGE family epimerase/isomerase [Rufibacter tibetensis]|nr:AGE family epimerase/isomerase [Rufibacter tibetensis]